jgi:hypothetical protein
LLITYSRKMTMLNARNLMAAPSGTFVGCLSSSLAMLCRAPSRCILQLGQRIDLAHLPVSEEVRRWV